MSLEIALISNKGIGAPLARAEREALQSGCEACVVVTRDARLDAELSPASCARVAALTHSYPGFGGLELLAALLLLGDLGGSPCAQIAQREGWSLPLVDALVGGGQALELPAAQLARASAGLLAQQAKLSHALALQSDLCSSGRRGLVGDGSPEVPEIELVGERTTANPGKPLLTIIVCAWQASTALPKLVASASDLRSDRRIEWIALDDGSSDQTLEVMRQEFAGFTRFKLLRLTQNGGIALARAAAWQHASGRFIIAADSDDALVPEGVRALLALIEAQQDRSDLILCPFQREQGDKIKLVDPAARMAQRGVSRLASFSWLWNTAVRREFIAERSALFNPHLQSGEDVHFFAQLFLQGPSAPRIASSEQPIYRYIVRKGSLSRSSAAACRRKWQRESLALLRVIAAASVGRAQPIDADQREYLQGLLARIDRSWKNAAMPLRASVQRQRLRDMAQHLGLELQPAGLALRITRALACPLLALRYRLAMRMKRSGRP